MALQELWMEADHNKIAAAVPEGYHITGFRQLANSFCDGRVAIGSCSGLTIISRFKFKEVKFHMYTYRGDVLKDLEWFAGKGVGRVRIAPREDIEIDVFNTHTIAHSKTVTYHITGFRQTNNNNNWRRVKQVEELMEHASRSTAQSVILTGDFNTAPIREPGEPYQIIRDEMTDCAEEVYPDEWLSPAFFTYGNDHNTYTRGANDSVTLDYVFYKTNSNRTTVWTNTFKLPHFKTVIFRQGGCKINQINPSIMSIMLDQLDVVCRESREEEISFSDHEALETTIYMRRRSDSWPYL